MCYARHYLNFKPNKYQKFCSNSRNFPRLKRPNAFGVQVSFYLCRKISGTNIRKFFFDDNVIRTYKYCKIRLLFLLKNELHITFLEFE